MSRARRRLTLVATCAMLGCGALGAPLRADHFPDCPAGFPLTTGVSTYYTYTPGTGACTLPATPAGVYGVALSVPEYDAGTACGQCLRVWGPEGSIVARVVDECPGCGAGHIDLETAGFAAIAPLAAGIVDVAYWSIECPTTGNVSWELQGSNPFYVKAQIRNQPYALSAMDLFYDSTWHAMARTVDGYFELSTGVSLTPPIQLRATDIHGHVIADSVPLTNDTDLPGSTQFKRCNDLHLDGFDGGATIPVWSTAEPYSPPP